MPKRASGALLLLLWSISVFSQAPTPAASGQAAAAATPIGTLPELSTVLKQFQAHDEEFEQVSHTIVEEERPPMLELPEYREKFGIK